MPLPTTTIGAYPKPAYLNLPDWFQGEEGPDTADPTATYLAALDALGEQRGQIIERAVRDAVTDQVACGVDIPTDGEIKRENYIHYHCRSLAGFDFDHLSERPVRGGNYVARLPTITGPVSSRTTFLPEDFALAQSCTDRPVKMTLPGPMTIGDTTADAYYPDPRTRGAALADCLNHEVRALAEAGCRHIQVDEPVFARNAQAALDYGVEHLERVFHRCPRSVTRFVHICCGYPDRLDHPDYPKAPPESYLQLARELDDTSVHAISIEDAHRHNDLMLLERFTRSTVVLGAVAIARSEVESMEAIRERLVAALAHIDADRLMVAPDCGLGLLGRDLALSKLRNMCEAARSL